MNKIARLMIMGILVITSIVSFTGCGRSDKFEGKWTTDIVDKSMGFKIDPEAHALEIKKNGDKDYIVKYYTLRYSSKTDDVVDSNVIEATAQKGGSDNTIKIMQGVQPVITYNEEKKCLQFAGNMITGKLETFKLAKDDKAYQEVKDAIKKANKEQAEQTK